MIPVDILLSPLAIAGFVTGVVVAFLAGRVRQDPPHVILMSALGSGLALAALAWANEFGGGPLFAAAAVGLGASLWAIGNERSRRPTIR
jgi:peptidoglycan/LPS O-acetylase OafA/YrhL